MGLHQIDSIANYVRFLRENTHEIDLLFKELLIGVTSFFRDPAAWEHLRQDVMPALISARATGGGSAGLGAGLLDRRGGLFARDGVPGGDRAVQAGEEPGPADLRHRPRSGGHRQGAPGSVPRQHRRRRLARAPAPVLRARRIAATASARRSARWWCSPPRTSSWIRPSPGWTSSSCRNLLIYLSSELQKKLIPLFHYSLNAGRRAFPRQRRDDRSLLRAVLSARRQDPPLSAARSVGHERPGRVPCDGLRRVESGGRRGRQPGRTEADAHQSAGPRRSPDRAPLCAGRPALATTRATGT